MADNFTTMTFPLLTEYLLYASTQLRCQTREKRKENPVFEQAGVRYSGLQGCPLVLLRTSS